MSMRWSEAVTLEFVKLYLKSECLWNPSDPNYKNRKQRERSYDIICSDFRVVTGKSLTKCDVKTKIKNLRTTYSQQVHKILKCSTDPDSIYEPSLVWFHQMDERLKHLPTRNLTFKWRADEEAQQQSQPTDDKAWAEHSTDNPDPDPDPDPLVPPAASGDDYEATSKHERASRRIKLERNSTTCNNFKMEKRKKVKRKREKASPVYEEAECAVRPGRGLLVAVEDEFDIYGKYIASQLRKMELQKALKLQIEISNLVAGVRLSDISDSQDV